MLGKGIRPSQLAKDLEQRWQAVEMFEVRLDMTVLWCFALGRELIRGLRATAPRAIEIHVGFTPAKLAHLMDVMGSSCSLCFLWILCRILTGHFVRAGFSGDLRSFMGASLATCLSSGLLWQLLEQYLYSGARPDLLEAVPLDLPGAAGSVLALSAVMLSYRLFSWYVP